MRAEVIKTSFQNQDQHFKILSRPRPRPRLCISRRRPFCDVYYRGRLKKKHFFAFSAINKMPTKMKILFRAEKETKTKMDIHFRRKNENESHLIILVFFFLFIHSVTKSALQCAANYLVQFRFFCRWSLLTGFHFPHVRCIDIFVAFF